jgi:hypothetical protein
MIPKTISRAEAATAVGGLTELPSVPLSDDRDSVAGVVAAIVLLGAVTLPLMTQFVGRR